MSGPGSPVSPAPPVVAPPNSVCSSPASPSWNGRPSEKSSSLNGLPGTGLPLKGRPCGVVPWLLNQWSGLSLLQRDSCSGAAFSADGCSSSKYSYVVVLSTEPSGAYSTV